MGHLLVIGASSKFYLIIKLKDSVDGVDYDHLIDGKVHPSGVPV